jgi:hypothetical protein
MFVAGWLAVLVCPGWAAAAPLALGATRYVSSEGKEAAEGGADSPWSLAKANAAAEPGDTICLLDGVYKGTPIAPARSGREGKPITYKADKANGALLTAAKKMPGPFPDDDSDQPAAIFLLDRSHIVVDGIAVKDPGGRFLYAGGASFITVQNCHFENTEYPGAWESCRFKRVGDHIVFRGNVVKKGNDSVAITGGSFHLIEGNTFEGAQHTCLVLMGVERSVIRENTLRNRDQKLMEVFSTRQSKWKDPQRKSRRLLIERNRFELAGYGLKDGFSGIQYAGNDSILRRNIFRRCGTGMDFAGYGGTGDKRGNPEALHNQHNRFYNNVIYDCGTQYVPQTGASGINFARDHKNFGDLVLVNNIICRNRSQQEAGKKTGAAENTAQIMFRWDCRPTDAILLNNLILCDKPGQNVFYWQDAQYAKAGHPDNVTLQELERLYPRNASGNIEAEPKFVDADKGDFRLQDASPCIDAGRLLSRTRSAGTGTVVEVEDVLFFTDGHGIVEADILRIGESKVKVTKVDYEANALTLDRSVSWQKGEPVTLDYAGNAPDLGAFESAASRPLPAAPAAGRIPGAGVADAAAAGQPAASAAPKTPPPPAPKGRILLLPENLSAQGGGEARVENGRPGAVDGILTNWDDTGHWLEWRFESAAAGTYEVIFRYSMDARAPRQMLVNGEPVPGLKPIDLPVTGGWNDWREAKLPALITLKAGQNAIRMESGGGEGMNIDDITLAPAKEVSLNRDKPLDDGGERIVLLPDQLSAQDGGKAEKVPDYAGARNVIVANWDDKGHWLEWAVRNAAEGDYEITLRYATDGFPLRQVSVNGKIAEKLDCFEFPSTLGWDRWQEETLPALVRLQAGANALRLTGMGGNGLNLDLIVLRKITGSWAPPQPAKRQPAPNGDLIFSVSGDHFEEPPAGLVEGILAARPVCAFFVGDIVFNSKPQDFAVFRKLFLAPFRRDGIDWFPVMGNHDFPVEPNWKALWGEEKGRHYYSFDLGKAHFIVLDANRIVYEGRKYKENSEEDFIVRQGADLAKGSEQYNWLVKDLESTQKPFLFVFHHEPVITFGEHGLSPALQRTVAPLFERHKVTAVFSGHDHAYQRFVPIRFDLTDKQKPVPVADDRNGVVYITPAAGDKRGNLYDVTPSPLHARQKTVATFAVISIEGRTARGKAIAVPSGEVIDTFEIESRR